MPPDHTSLACLCMHTFTSDTCNPPSKYHGSGLVIQKISDGARRKHTLSPEESLRRSVSLGNYTHNGSRANMRAVTAAKTIKNAYSNTAFSSVTAVTESLGLSDNDFKTA